LRALLGALGLFLTTFRKLALGPFSFLMLKTVQDRMGDLHRFVDSDRVDNRAGDGFDTVVFEVEGVAMRGALL